jgi:chemotaxis protein MotB
MAHTARANRRRHGGGGHDSEEHPDERWLVTYADMLTLLLVLFIVMYAMSVVDPTKFVELRAGLTSAFDPGQNSVITSTGGGVTTSDDSGSDDAPSNDPQIAKQDISTTTTTTILDEKTSAAVRAYERAATQAQATRVQTEVNNLKGVAKTIEAALAAQGLSGAAQFSVDKRGLVITVVTSSVVFGGNSADLLQGGQRIIDLIARPLLALPNRVEVDGHTNQQKVSTYPFISGWELSSARACAVVRYLIGAFAFPAARLSAVGFSDQKPLYPESDPRAVTANRRVDLVVVSTLSAADRALLATVANPTGLTAASR